MPGLVFIGFVVAILSSLGAPLVPDLAKDYGVSLSSAQWTLTIAFLVSAAATPTMGRVGDGPHRRTMILAGLAVVCVGGILAALPASFPVLLAGRALQGVGLGLTPLTIATARGSLSAERAAPAVSMLSLTTVAGVGLGYPLTGLIVEIAGVHAAFAFGAVMAGVAIVVAFMVVPPSRGPATALDIPGALLLAGALGGVLLAISEGPEWGWTSPKVLGLLAVGVLLAAAWVAWERRARHPLVDLSLLRARSVLTADVAAVLAGVGMYLLISIVTRYIQTPRSAGYGLGASVLTAGLVLVPFSATSLISQRIAAKLLRRMTPARVLPLSCIPMVAALGLFAFARDGLVLQLVLMGVAGLGIGMIFAVMPGLIVSAVPAEQTGSAISFNQVARLIGYSAGSALSAVVLQAATPAGSALPQDHGYTEAALLGAGLWIITAVVVLVVPGHGKSKAAPSASADAEANRQAAPAVSGSHA